MKTLCTAFQTMTKLLWPPRCSGCAALVDTEQQNLFELFCSTCAESLSPILSPRCPLCSIPFQSVGEDRRCGHCTKDPPPFKRGEAAYEYGGALVNAVRQWKYGKAPWLGKGLSLILFQALKMSLKEIQGQWVVVPVPSHPKRLLTRGFNPAAILAGPLADGLRFPLDTNTLKRRGDIAPQASLSRKQRLAHMKGAFYTTGEGLKERDVILVDDIVTTTATVRSASQVLMDAGVSSVRFVALARTT